MDEAFKIVLDRLVEVSAEAAHSRTTRSDLESRLIEFERRPAAPSRDDIVEMFRAMADGKKIEAIKYYRNLTGWGLKESKDAIEAAMSPPVA